MITFHSVTKIKGRGPREKVVLDQLDFTLPLHAHLVILGLRGSGKTTFLDILSGTQLPTTGWVERRGVVSAPGWSWLLRHGSVLTTPRQLCRRLAAAYHADPREIGECVADFTGFREQMDLPIPLLSVNARQKMGLALFYALPCDMYLFDTSFETSNAELRERCLDAYLQRRQASGMVLVTHLPQVARKFGGTGAVLSGGQLTVFRTVEDAIDEHLRLEREKPPPQEDDMSSESPLARQARDEGEDAILF